MWYDADPHDAFTPPRGLAKVPGPSAFKRRVGRVKQIIRELKRQAAGETLEPEQLKGLIRAGYVYRNDDEHLLTDQGRQALAQPGVYPGVAH
jgi:hypothetical protein